MAEQQRRIYTEQSPPVQHMADQLEACWNRIRGALLKNPRYRVQEKYRKTFEKAAIKVLTMKINPELFVQAQLRTPADAARCQPTYLTGPKAMERYKHFVGAQQHADVGVYISQLNLIDRLRSLGRSWEDIEQGSYNLSPLVLWAMFSMNGMEERAEPYYRSAKAEFARCPDLVNLFGPSIARLGK